MLLVNHKLSIRSAYNIFQRVDKNLNVIPRPFSKQLSRLIIMPSDLIGSRKIARYEIQLLGCNYRQSQLLANRYFIGLIRLYNANNSCNEMSDRHIIFTQFFLHPEVILFHTPCLLMPQLNSLLLYIY